MSMIDREKLIHEAETCRENADSFDELIKQQSSIPIRINLNENVKFKLTDLGKEVFCHQYDKANDWIRPLMAENLRKMAKSPQCVKIVSVKQGL